MILSSYAETNGGTESGAASAGALPCLAPVPGEVGRGASTVEAGLAGAESGKEIAPPDWATAISSRRDVAASSLRRSDQPCSSIQPWEG
jgi:hypothetical protein